MTHEMSKLMMELTQKEYRAKIILQQRGKVKYTIEGKLETDGEVIDTLRPDISTHFASILSNNLNLLIEQYVKDSVSKSFLPAYSQQTSAMHQDILGTEILNVKKDSITWQTEAARSQEALIRELEHSVRILSDQVKFLTMNASTLSAAHHRLPTTQPAAYTTQATTKSYSQPTQPTSIHGSWYSSSTIAAPQASHLIAPPPPPPAPASQHSPPTQPQREEWDDTYLSVLSTQDPKQLRELLARSNPEIVMPLNGPGPLSVLRLIQQLAATVGETPPVGESLKSALWWLQRAATVLNINEPLISPYVARVVPNVKAMLNTIKQRLSILPGPPQLMDSVRTISDIQDTLTRKQA
ncbi:hypothetical protein BKA82DRAFT_4465527 [Pisolithus tinctorius]|nr:hypothetical protein BKA82DRAFT_4465527 [Pisolithus tinctorius]